MEGVDGWGVTGQFDSLRRRAPVQRNLFTVDAGIPSIAWRVAVHKMRSDAKVLFA